MDLDKAISKVHTISKVISSCKMSIQRSRVELSENINFIDSTVYAVAHRHINQPICTSYRHLSKDINHPR